MWLLLLFIHVLGLTGFNLSLRRSLVGKVDPLTLATVMQTGIAIPALFLLVFKPMDFGVYEPKYYVGLVAEILLAICLHVTNVKSLQYLEASVYPVFYNLRILIITVLGILFLNEEVVLTRIFGGMLILLAIIIVRQKGSKSIRRKGIEWGITAAFVVSFLNMNEKLMIENIGLFNYYPLAMVLAAILMWGYLISTRKNIPRSLLIQPEMVRLMILRVISGYAFPLALAAGALASVANYISAMSVILMVILGVVWLGERDYLKRKIMATLVAAAGLTMILLSHLI